LGVVILPKKMKLGGSCLLFVGKIGAGIFITTQKRLFKLLAKLTSVLGSLLRVLGEGATDEGL